MTDGPVTGAGSAGPQQPDVPAHPPAGAGRIAADGRVPVIAVQGITKHFGSIQALRGVDLEVNRGDVVGLVIHNPAEEGSRAVQDAYDYLTGNKSAIKKSVLLPNVVATNSTANSPMVTPYYYKTSA